MVFLKIIKIPWEIREKSKMNLSWIYLKISLLSVSVEAAQPLHAMHPKLQQGDQSEGLYQVTMKFCKTKMIFF